MRHNGKREREIESSKITKREGNRGKDEGRTEEERGGREGGRQKKETGVLYAGRDDRGGTMEVIRIHTRMKEALRGVCLKESR